MPRQTRKIVHIDQDKCDGCGLCVPNCAEGAIQVINGKARLVADRLCDGLGACLGHCPKDAIRVEERPADEFDESAVASHLLGFTPTSESFSSPLGEVGRGFSGTNASLGSSRAKHPHAQVRSPSPSHCPDRGSEISHLSPPPLQHTGGCPGSRVQMLSRPTPAGAPAGGRTASSQLRQWPVQLTLLPTSGPIWQDADVLLAADCVPFAYPAFHQNMLVGKTLAIACPKLDDCESYVQKLAAIFASNSIRSVTVARMEVPCCGGLVRVAQMALAQAGRQDIPLKTIMVKVDGTI